MCCLDCPLLIPFRRALQNGPSKKPLALLVLKSRKRTALCSVLQRVCQTVFIFIPLVEAGRPDRVTAAKIHRPMLLALYRTKD